MRMSVEMVTSSPASARWKVHRLMRAATYTSSCVRYLVTACRADGCAGGPTVVGDPAVVLGQVSHLAQSKPIMVKCLPNRSGFL